MNHPLMAKQQGVEGGVISPGVSHDDVSTLSPQSHGNGEIISQIEQVLERLRQNQIMIPQSGEVYDYLIRFSDVIDLLPSICKAAREQFGMDTQLSLEIYHDPEIEDEYLALYVRQKRYAPDILDTIENISTKFDTELARMSGWLLVTTDFDPPR